MSPITRALRVLVFTVCGLVLLAEASWSAVGWVWRLISAIGVVAAVLAVRIVLGPAIVVTPDALVIQRTWPAKRRIPWYRIDHAEVMPGFWTILVELIDGERLELPCVEHIDDLYANLEHYRTALDSA
jgi:hypothetical protein